MLIDVTPEQADLLRSLVDAFDVAAESQAAPDTAKATGKPPRRTSYPVEIVDLVSAGYLIDGEPVELELVTKGITATARISGNGVALGTSKKSLALTAAVTVVTGTSQNGWTTWRRSSDGTYLATIRRQYLGDRGESSED